MVLDSPTATDSVSFLLLGAASDFDLQQKASATFPSFQLPIVDRISDPAPEDSQDVDKEVPRPASPLTEVVKQGAGTGVTFGHLGVYRSLVRYIGTSQSDQRSASMEQTILPADRASVALFGFSAEGDSGAAVVKLDSAGGQNELVSMITSGGRSQHITDITYSTRLSDLWPIIKKRFPGARLGPALATE